MYVFLWSFFKFLIIVSSKHKQTNKQKKQTDWLQAHHSIISESLKKMFAVFLPLYEIEGYNEI